MNSFNHYSLGSVLSWLYQYVLGIRREEEHPGFTHFRLEPVMERSHLGKRQCEFALRSH